ncbi:PilZ domain-containing protein [Altererythrobacter aquiaggeris]|uniref:PilZ domain-containing protein n=1 Tax=Aestuarierythrobacter aquiaggeris TaxID=1898396 RepID=UPI003018392D
MSAVETRHIPRDSLFLAADVRFDGMPDTYRVKVRNLSPGGMMAEGSVPVSRGAQLLVDLRNVGTVEGSVAWVQDNRFGIAFTDEIDPGLAREPVSGNAAGKAAYPSRPVKLARGPDNADSLRKI